MILVCNNICIRENKIFQVNKVLVDVFQKEAKTLRIDAITEAENNTKLTNEGDLPVKVKGKKPDDKRNSKQNPNEKRIFFCKFLILFQF